MRGWECIGRFDDLDGPHQVLEVGSPGTRTPVDEPEGLFNRCDHKRSNGSGSGGLTCRNVGGLATSLMTLDQLDDEVGEDGEVGQ